MLTDAVGTTFSCTDPPKRVASLVPSITETLFDLGVGDSVVAITDYCIFPSDLERPRVGGTKNPRVEELRSLAPDLVHMNLEENLSRHADAISSFAPVFVTEPKSIEDVELLFRYLGAIHHRQSEAAEWIGKLQRERAAMPRSPFSFACPIWKDPWMWCGGDTYVSRLVEAAGGRNVLDDRTRYPALDLEGVLSLRPDVVFLPDEPYAFTAEDAGMLGGSRVIGPFPGHLFTWHGSRTLLGLRYLRDVLGDDRVNC
jgi:ABC-type Fe3+-hydroxamate transport system substrate-binding protein